MLLDNLRQRTAYQHQALENCDLLKDLMSSAVTIDHYTVYLSRLYGFVNGFEEHGYSLLGNLLLDISARKKAALLRSDLLHSEVDVNRLPFVPISLLERLYPTQFSALGAMYVLEGSSLGAAIIYKHLHGVLASEINGKAAYLQAYGSQTGYMWGQFLNSLHGPAENHWEEIIRSAGRTFSCLYSWITSVTINVIDHEYQKSCQ